MITIIYFHFACVSIQRLQTPLVKWRKMPIHTYSPHNADGLKECDVHEADGGGVVVNQVEPVDPTLQPTQ